MGLHFDIVDVFTDRAYAGNPLAVVHRARTLTARQMQAIAAEFGLSETAFTLPPTTSRGDLPAADLHPGPRAAVRRAPEHRGGLGAGVRRHDPAGDVVQECGAGLLPVHVDGPGRRVVGGSAGGGAGPGRRRAGRDRRSRRGRPRRRPAGRGRGGRGAVRLPAGAARRRGAGGAGRRRGGRGDGASRRGSWWWPWTARPARRTLRVFCPQVGVAEDPATGLGGGGARACSWAARGAAGRAVRAVDRAGRRDGAAVDAGGARADRRAGPRWRSRSGARCGWWRRASCWRCRTRDPRTRRRRESAEGHGRCRADRAGRVSIGDPAPTLTDEESPVSTARHPCPPVLPGGAGLQPEVHRQGPDPARRPGLPRPRGRVRAAGQARRPQDDRGGAQRGRLGRRGSAWSSGSTTGPPSGPTATSPRSSRAPARTSTRSCCRRCRRRSRSSRWTCCSPRSRRPWATRSARSGSRRRSRTRWA